MFSVPRGLLARINRWRHGVSLMEEADIWRLFIVCAHRRELLKHGEPPPRTWMEKLRASPPPFAEQKSFVHAELQVQALQALRSAHDGEADYEPSFDLRRIAERSHDAPTTCSGVRLDGYANAGDLVAFFPGVVYTTRDVWHLPGGIESLRGANLFARHDGSIVNASELGALPAAGARHPLALAHEISHPPEGREPNVAPFGLDLELAALQPELRAHVPNLSFAALPSERARESRESMLDLMRHSITEGEYPGGTLDGQPVAMPAQPTLVMVALREIDHEELLLNYRLNPKNARPSWYKPVSGIEEDFRWAMASAA